MDVVEADLEAAEPRLLEQPDGGIEGRQLRLDLGDLLLDPLDLLGRGLRDAVDQAVDGGGGRALAGHDQRRLAGEGGVEHAVAAAADDAVRLLGHGVEAELVDGVPGDGGLPDTGIAEHPEHLLLRGPVPEPVLDLADRLGLQVGGREALAHAALPAAPGVGAHPAEVEVGADRDPRRQLVGLDRAQDVDRLVGELLRLGRIEGDDLVVELLGVLVHRREQGDLELHVGHVELALGEVDRLGLPEPALDQVGPGPLVQRLVLEQRRPDDADVGTADDHAVDVAAQAPAGDAEAELPAVTATGAQIEPGRLQPANRQVLELVTGIEDPQQSAVEVLAVVDRRERDLVGEPAGARARRSGCRRDSRAAASTGARPRALHRSAR